MISYWFHGMLVSALRKISYLPCRAAGLNVVGSSSASERGRTGRYVLELGQHEAAILMQTTFLQYSKERLFLNQLKSVC